MPDEAALCSQATLSRLENTPGPRDLIRMARAMVALYCASFRQVPRRITLDIDDTFDAVHGGQQLRLFIAYYDEYGFQPIIVFDGDGRPVAALLRPARRPTGAEARSFLRRLVREIRGHWPRVEIMIRADSHYCAPEVLDFCRAGVSTSCLALPPPPPCAGMSRRWRPAPPAATRAHRAHRAGRSRRATRSFTTVPPAGSSRPASSH